jgi:putative drug exporter of the RND superfamily
MAGSLTEVEKNVDVLSAAFKKAGQGDGFDVLVTGGPSINRDFPQIGESDLKTGEIVGVGVALVILVLVFGALVAAGIPLSAPSSPM